MPAVREPGTAQPTSAQVQVRVRRERCLLPAGRGRLRAQNTHLGITDTVTEPASTAALIGGFARLRHADCHGTAAQAD
jgi:hypothetical protein